MEQGYVTTPSLQCRLQKKREPLVESGIWERHFSSYATHQWPSSGLINCITAPNCTSKCPWVIAQASWGWGVNAWTHGSSISVQPPICNFYHKCAGVSNFVSYSLCSQAQVLYTAKWSKSRLKSCMYHPRKLVVPGQQLHASNSDVT